MLKPVNTEKATNLGKKGMYTFWVDSDWNKARIKSEVAREHKVNVIAVKTLNVRGKKKAIISLKEGQKLDIYEEKKKKKGKDEKSKDNS